jgi:dUTP pyrophosphatase
VQVVLQFRQVGGEKAPISADGVPAQGRGPRLGDVRLHEVERQPARLLQGHRGGDHRIDQAAPLVHGPHEVVHPGQDLGRVMHDEVRPLGHDLQFVVGDKGGDLHDGVAGRIQPRHLQVEPDQHAGIVGCPAVAEVPLVRLDADVALPAYARPGDAGADLVARQGVVLRAGGGRSLVPTGVAVAIPEGYAGLVLPRSGLALRHGVTVLNAPGLIDAGYRDEIKVLLVNTDPARDYEVRPGDRIAQLVIQPIEQATFVPVADLPPSERGLGGFGHSGR